MNDVHLAVNVYTHENGELLNAFGARGDSITSRILLSITSTNLSATSARISTGIIPTLNAFSLFAGAVVCIVPAARFAHRIVAADQTKL